MTSYYGTGTFCSRSCVNSRHHTDETIKKISESVSKISDNNNSHRKHLSFVEEYNKSPSRCVICNNELSYEHRNDKTCCKECKNLLLSRNCKTVKQAFGQDIVGRHIVYKVIMKDDPRYYIGVRKTDSIEFDGYLGSGIIIGRLVKKYGIDKFERITLFEYNNSKDAYLKERELLLEALNDPNCVNIAVGGQGGNTLSGMVGVSKNGTKKFVHPDDLQCYLDEGYHIGWS